MVRNDLPISARPIGERAASLGLYMTHFNSGLPTNTANGFRLFRKPVKEGHFAGGHIAHFRTMAQLNKWIDGYFAYQTISPLVPALRTALEAIQAHDRQLDDPHGDGSGNDAQSPTGDDYNGVCGVLQPLYDLLGMVGPLSPWDERCPAKAGDGKS